MNPEFFQIGAPSGGNTPTFVQNGQIDWVAFSRTVWSTSSALLQRFASAQVQPITLGTGLALAAQFELDHVGNERMDKALKSMSGTWGFEKVLYFGFGVRSFVGVMADSQLGIQCVALCSALSEMHGEDVSAWVLEELWNLHDYPRQYLPSHSQLVALVKACSGVLAKTSFSRAADRMLGHTFDLRDTLPWAGSHEDIAKTLQALFKISKGKVSNISVLGGLECAFVGALAHWLFNLKVYVEDELTNIVYQDAIPEAAQVLITYRKPDDLALLQISETTHILRELDSLFLRNPKLDQILLTFRTPWNGCLARIFGSTFTELTRLPHILGGFLGSAARVYRALATGEAAASEFRRLSYFNFPDLSHGQGFLRSVTSVFAELEQCNGLSDAMQRAESVSAQEALRTVEQTVINLAQICKCSRCTLQGIPTGRACASAVVFVIRSIISTASCTVKDPNVMPTIRGIQMLYSEMSNALCTSLSSELPLLSVALDLEMVSTPIERRERYRKLDLLSRPVELFSGHSAHDRYYTHQDTIKPAICTAVVHQGMCYHLDCLRAVTDQPEIARLVHLLPGHIQLGDCTFNTVHDPGKVGSSRLSSIQYDKEDGYDGLTRGAEMESPQLSPLTSVALPKRWVPRVNFKPLALERTTESELVVFFEVSIENEPTIRLRPGCTAYTLLKRTGLVTCDRPRCDDRRALRCGRVRHGWLEDNRVSGQANQPTDSMCLIWPPLSEAARCIVIAINERPGRLFLRREACLSCCTISIMRQMDTTDHGATFHII